jgi:hypothetical protein
MIRGVLFSVVLSGILIFVVVRMSALYEEALPERVTRVDIYSDRITYRTNSYASPSLLAIGLKAAHDAPEKLALHDCSRMEEFETVIGILREQGYSSLDIELPDDC